MPEQKPTVHVAHNTPEQVALGLFHLIAQSEKWVFHQGATGGYQTADREWILDTYAECIRTIREPQARAVPPALLRHR